MGTFYEVRCMDCDACGGVYADRRPDVARALVAAAPHLTALAEVFQRDEVRGGYPELRFDRNLVDLEFFAKHAGHRLTAADGYSRDLGQCIGHGGVWCALAYGHEGPCNAEGPHKRRIA